jgi:hypothetical protein
MKLFAANILALFVLQLDVQEIRAFSLVQSRKSFVSSRLRSSNDSYSYSYGGGSAGEKQVDDSRVVCQT